MNVIFNRKNTYYFLWIIFIDFENVGIIDPYCNNKHLIYRIQNNKICVLCGKNMIGK